MSCQNNEDNTIKTVTNQDRKENPTISHSINDTTSILPTKHAPIESLQAELYAANKKIEDLSREKDRFYSMLQKKQIAFNELLMQHNDDICACEKEIAYYIEIKKNLEVQVDQLKLKGKRYDDLQESLTNIRMKAESAALNLVEEAQSQLMEAFTIIDEIASSVLTFQSDLTIIKKDLKIGSDTLENLLEVLIQTLTQNTKKLKNMKKRFYEVNKIPLDEDASEYISVEKILAQKQYLQELRQNKQT